MKRFLSSLVVCLVATELFSQTIAESDKKDKGTSSCNNMKIEDLPQLPGWEKLQKEVKKELGDWKTVI